MDLDVKGNVAAETPPDTHTHLLSSGIVTMALPRLKAVVASATMISCGLFCIAGSRSGPITRQGPQIDIDLRNAPVNELLDGLSAQTHRVMVLDADFGARRQNFRYSGPAPEIKKAIAGSLDLDIREGKSGSWLITKKFEKEPGLPQADGPQVRAWATSALRILPNARPISDHSGWGVEFRRLAGTLNLAQSEALRSGRSIGYNELNPVQRAQLAACINARLFGLPRYYWSFLAAASEDMEDTQVRLEQNTRQIILDLPKRSQLDSLPFGVILPEAKP